MRGNTSRGGRLRLALAAGGVLFLLAGGVTALRPFDAHRHSCGSALVAVGRPDHEPMIAGLANLAKLRHDPHPVAPSPAELASFRRLLDTQGRYVACHDTARSRMVVADLLALCGLVALLVAVAWRPWPTSSPVAAT